MSEPEEINARSALVLFSCWIVMAYVVARFVDPDPTDVYALLVGLVGILLFFWL